MKRVWLAASLLGVAVTIYALHDLLLLIFAAALFAIPLRAAALFVSRITRTHVVAGFVGVLAVLIALVALVLWSWELLIAAQAGQLVAAVRAAAAVLRHALSTEPWSSRLAVVLPDPSVLLAGAGGLIGQARGLVGGGLATLLDGAVLLFLTVCFAAEPATYVNGALRLVPPGRRARVSATLTEAAAIAGLWLRARLISMCALGLLVSIGLRIAGIPDFAALGLLAGIFAFVPNVGAVAAALPALMLASLAGWREVAIVAVIYWLAHAIDDFLVAPIAERRVVRLPPALTVVTQVVLGLASGVLGIMMAAPLAAVAIVFVRRLLVEDVVERGAGDASAFIVAPATIDSQRVRTEQRNAES